MSTHEPPAAAQKGDPPMDELPIGDKASTLSGVPLAPQPSSNDLARIFLSMFALLIVTVGSFWAALNPSWVQALGQWGYVGVALISFTSSATVILPAPGLAVVFSMGGVLNPIWLGILAGIGSGLGELSGYIAGASGRALINSDRVNPLLHRFASRYTLLALFVLAMLPLPVFDFVGILAGAMRLRLPVFLGAVLSGKIIKHIAIALAGAGSLPLLRHLLGF